MIAVCENPSCGAIFEVRGFISGGGNATVQMTGNKVGPCPRCGSMGYVPDGVYEYKDYLLTLVKGPKESFEILLKVKALLEIHQKRSQPATKQDIIDEIEKISPRVAEIVKKAPHTNSLAPWIAIAIAAINLLMNTHQNYLKPKDKTSDNKISEMFIQHLLDDNKKLTDKTLRIDSLKTDTLITKKVGRNDPCPCKSGKKYKKCCGNPIKNPQPLQSKNKAVSDTIPDQSVNDN